MELTSEQRLRIEEEERRRVAEEQYRAEVRARLQTESAPASIQAISERPKRSTSFLTIMLCLAAGAIGVIAISNVASSRDRPDPSPSGASSATTASIAPRIRYVPVNQKVSSGQIVVRAGGYVQYRIRIEPDMRNARIVGSFNASGGSGNDIAAVIADENEFQNWINGHTAKVFYSTQGKKTTDQIDAPLPPGTYILAFSNQFSSFTEKHVFLQVDLKYSRLETY